MSKNNQTTLTGNMGSDARIVPKGNKVMAAFSLATTDSYKDGQGNYQDKATVWHNILAFNPRIVKMIESLKKGTRIKVEGALSYRPFPTINEEGKEVNKNEASIIAENIVQAPLWKKLQNVETTSDAALQTEEISSTNQEPS